MLLHSIPGGRSRDLSDAGFRAIYEREFDYVWKGLRRLGVPSGDLPDVTHDVFLKVFCNLHKYEPERPFRPWLFGILFRVASDHQRLGRNKREVLFEVPEPVDPAPSPHDTLRRQEQWRQVDRALSLLDPRHRVVLVMHDFSGHSARDVARELNIPFKTVFSRLRTARLRFILAANQMGIAPEAR